MKRFAIAVAVIAMLGFDVQAEDAKPFYLNRDGTVEQRLDTVTTEVEKLRNEVNALKAALADKPKAKPAAAAAAAVQQIVYQVCVDGRCSNFVTDDMAKVPLGAKILSTAAVAPKAPCPCGDNCQCVSQASASAFGDACADGSCATGASSSAGSQRTGIWFPGKRIIGRIFNR